MSESLFQKLASSLQIYGVPLLEADGVQQMALDEALLQWVHRPEQSQVLIVRAYQWSAPTLSLGVHQQERDIARAYQVYAQGNPVDIVRRPTGGRAILHGEDVSFAFVTNHPVLMQLNLEDSYCFFTTWVRRALEQLEIPLQTSCDAGTADYIRSPLCFETKTPSDLQTPAGQKVAGSAQLRRKGGILQHGAAFLRPFQVSAQAFDLALCSVIEHDMGMISNLDPMAVPSLLSEWEQQQKLYRDVVSEIRNKLSTTVGSHLLPASN